MLAGSGVWPADKMYVPGVPTRCTCLACRQDARAWRAMCTGRGEVPVGRGALESMMKPLTL
eukprot:2883076-Amphidinium_carterae.2